MVSAEAAEITVLTVDSLTEAASELARPVTLEITLRAQWFRFSNSEMFAVGDMEASESPITARQRRHKCSPS